MACTNRAMIYAMSNGEHTAQTVSRTVWILGQMRGYATKQALADAMGWDRSRLSRTLSGDRQWTIEDLEVAARALGLKPGDLFRPLAELIGAITPLGGDVTEIVTTRYPYPTSDPNGPLAQVIPLIASYRTVTTNRTIAPATVTRIGASQRGQRAYSA